MVKTLEKSFIDQSLLNQAVKQMVKNKNNFGAVLCVEQGNDFSWINSAGNLKVNDQFFITSVTKLFVTAVILKLRAENRLHLDDKISIYLSNDIMDGIHVLNGVDYSNEITLQHLISNTSGIADYFFQKQANGKAGGSNLFKGQDEAWPLGKTLESIKQIKPQFKPEQKASYCGTNYQLLGRIIENITGMSIKDVFKSYIFDELNLSKTYVYENENDTKPVSLYYKSQSLHLPKFISCPSFTPEGGIVSTAQETMTFLKAFFNGRFFQKEEIESLKKWRLIFRPSLFYYGIGLEKLWVPRIVSPFKPIGDILGFWGQSGAFAFYHPKRDLYFTGTVNQSSGIGHNSAFNAMIKIIKAVDDRGHKSNAP
ncbi:serine hydrolase domain-containing protein [Siminovitchia terrae]|uniref:serine hydrolase domain-containing protein n=1 Tax=Siminovitchia terrae TaxID=1914933 RepID=UPI0028AF454C|nr:serine hydrolase domain-containing protein [Siminovitchia terrae]